MLDNNEIIGNVGDIENTKTAKKVGDGRDSGDVKEAKNARDVGNIGEAGNKKASRGNKGGEQENIAVDNDERGHGRDQEANKVDYNGVDNRIGIGRVSKDIKLGNNGMDNDARNQDNRRIIVEDVEDSDDAIVDFIYRVLANILIDHFGPLSS